MKWIKFEDEMPKEYPSMFANKYGTQYWKDGIMWLTNRYDLLFTLEHNGKRIVVDGHMIDGKQVCDYARVYPETKYIAWMPYPEPYEGE